MNKRVNLTYTAIAVAVLVVFITVLSVAGYNAEGEIQQLSQRPLVRVGTEQGTVAGVAVEKANLVINRASGNSVSMEIEVEDNMTAYDALQLVAEDFGFSLKTKQHDFGIEVQGIGDLVGGEGSDKYWLYYVNGEMAVNAVDKQVVLPGDKIEFRFEESPF